MTSPRTRGRPNSALLTRDKIADAALALIAASGYDGLTMAALARALGVVPSALYNHVSGRDELMLLIEDAVMGKIDATPLEQVLSGTLSPRAGLTQWAWNYRNAFADHTPLVHIIAVMPITGARQTVDMYELLVRVCAAAGIPDADILPRIVALESFIYGSAYDVRAPEGIFAAGPEEAPALARARAALRAATPSLADAAPAPDSAAAPANPHADLPFGMGLSALLADVSDTPLADVSDTPLAAD